MPDRKQTFILAIQSEIMSQNLYKMLSASFKKKPEISTVFDNLIPLESIHEEKLRELFASEFPTEILEIDSNLVPKIAPTEIDDPRKVLEFAISREDIANEIYSKMARDTEDPGTVRLLNELAEEEENHKIILQTEILRLEHLLTWYDSSELNGMMED